MLLDRGADKEAKTNVRGEKRRGSSDVWRYSWVLRVSGRGAIASAEDGRRETRFCVSSCVPVPAGPS